MTQKELKIKMYKGLGVTLIHNGQTMLNKAFNVKPQKISKSELITFLVNLGFSKDRIYCADKNYFLVDWETWEDLIEYDWIDQKKYVEDIFDCDNAADSFASHMTEIYGLNSAGKAKNIEILNTMGKHLGYHRANLIVSLNNNVLYARVLEPMTDKWCLVVKGKEIKIGNWIYKLKNFEFN